MHLLHWLILSYCVVVGGFPVTMPAIGLGTAGLFDATQSIVDAAIDIGVKLIDTAQAQEWYDEAAVAEVIRRRNVTDVFVVNKIHPRSYSLPAMRNALVQSHNNFGGKGKIDVILLHAPFCWQGHCTPEQEAVSWLDAWRHLEILREEFDIPHIGVSNLDIDQLEELVLHHANSKVAVLQNWMDPFHQDTQVRQFCADHDIVYMAYSSFGTQWSHSRRTNGRNPVMTNRVLLDIASRHNTTVTDVVLSWLAAENVVAIPRTSSIQHLEENFSICSANEGGYALCNREGTLHLPGLTGLKVSLSERELSQIRSLDDSLGSPWD